MSWLDWAVDDPAPGNCGYSALNVPCEVDSSLRRGGTIHSVWGYFTHVSPSAVMAARGNSWDVTVMRSGAVWRHRPRPTFVSWHGGGPAQNIGTWAMEVEGKDESWTEAQKVSILRVCKETWDWFGWSAVELGGPTGRTQEGIRQALLALPYGSFWEHNWLDNTNCPMGRNEWGWLIASLKEEPMPSEHDQHHQQLADRVANLEGQVADLLARVGGHEAFHRDTLDPSIQKLQFEMEAVLRDLAAGRDGGGLKRGDNVKLV